MSRECFKSLSPWFWMSRNFHFRGEGGGGLSNQECVRKRGGSYQAYVCVRGGGGQIAFSFKILYVVEFLNMKLKLNFNHFGAYVLTE